MPSSQNEVTVIGPETTIMGPTPVIIPVPIEYHHHYDYSCGGNLDAPLAVGSYGGGFEDAPIAVGSDSFDAPLETGFNN